MEPTDIQIENFFAREDLQFIDCPLCKRPLLRSSCEDRQVRYPPYKEGASSVAHMKQIRCAASGCKMYKEVSNARRKSPWKESDWKPKELRISPQQLEKIMEARRIAHAAEPLKGPERFYD
jgi:hypothetical protein